MPYFVVVVALIYVLSGRRLMPWQAYVVTWKGRKRKNRRKKGRHSLKKLLQHSSGFLMKLNPAVSLCVSRSHHMGQKHSLFCRHHGQPIRVKDLNNNNKA
jgi:hypothetical protein